MDTFPARSVTRSIPVLKAILQVEMTREIGVGRMRITIWLRPERDAKTTDAVQWFALKVLTSKEKATGLFFTFNDERESPRIRNMIYKLINRRPRPHELSVHSWHCNLEGRNPTVIVLDNAELIPNKIFVQRVWPMFETAKEVLIATSKYNCYVVRQVTKVQPMIDEIKGALRDLGETL